MEDIIYLTLKFYFLITWFRFIIYIISPIAYASPKSKWWDKNIHKDNSPLVSIIIPAWNETVGIYRTLESIAYQTYSNIEIIVVNDGSTDDTLSEIIRFSNTYKKYRNENIKKFTIINKDNSGKSAAINNGFLIAKGEYIITMDADSYLEETAIGNMIYSMIASNADAATGSIRIGNYKNIFGLVQWLEYTASFHIKKLHSLENNILVMGGAFVCYKSSTVDKIGLMNTGTITEDLDYTFRIIENGMKIIHVDNAVFITEAPYTFMQLLNQRIRWKYGFLQCLWRHKYSIYKIWINGKLGLLKEICNIFFILLEQILTPFLFGITLFTVLNTQSNLTFVLANISILYLPTILLIIPIIHSELKYKYNYFYITLGLILSPLLFIITGIIEQLALIISMYRILFKHKIRWEYKVRMGA